jgi:phenylacetyl-CoA:acceptor oxidoreductase subunit 2
VATKCTFCVDRIDDGLAKGLVPGVDPEASPACANACIADALAFGDIDDPNSNVSQLLAQNKHFRMHEELGTGPGFFYLWDHVDGPDKDTDMSSGPDPWLQTAWDARAAANFMLGGAGSGLVVATALATLAGGGPGWPFVLGALLVMLGLTAVWAEIGRPWRALNVFINPRTSWMTREALVAPAVPGLALAAALPHPPCSPGRWRPWPSRRRWRLLAFVYCQGRILRAARGIPAWREPAIVPLMMATALAEGAGLWLLLGGDAGAAAWVGFGAALAARQWLWMRWRARVRSAPAAMAVIQRAGRVFQAATLLPLATALLVLGTPLPPAAAHALQMAAGLLALAGGLWFKFTLITRAAFNQGFAITHLPVRGVQRREY